MTEKTQVVAAPSGRRTDAGLWSVTVSSSLLELVKSSKSTYVVQMSSPASVDESPSVSVSVATESEHIDSDLLRRPRVNFDANGMNSAACMNFASDDEWVFSSLSVFLHGCVNERNAIAPGR